MSNRWPSRNVTERVYISGTLVLDTPTHFGNGERDSLTDIPLLRDTLEPTRPLLTGASIAGALRNYLREFKGGYGVLEEQDGSALSERLFGYVYDVSNDEQRASYESRILIDDSLGTLPEGQGTEFRDGVSIDPKTRTAFVDRRGKGAKYDIELLPAGTTFPLHIEVLLNEEGVALLQGVAIALHGLQQGEIRLGMRKRRGYGQCHVAGWTVRRFPMDQAIGVLGWLDYEAPKTVGEEQDILTALDVGEVGDHEGEAFVVEARFHLDGSLLIRAAGEDANDPDMVHLHSRRGKRWQPVLSGTSLAGALRARALRIAHTMYHDRKHAESLVDSMFGRRIKGDRSAAERGTPTGSRLLVRESEVRGGVQDRVQDRVKIDRFTGGTFPGALFSQQAVWSTPRSEQAAQVEIHLELRKYPDSADFDAQVGLLLLLLKDLWTGDLPLGGESSMGRGRLQGDGATLKSGERTWTLSATEEGALLFAGSDPAELQRYVNALWGH